MAQAAVRQGSSARPFLLFVCLLLLAGCGQLAPRPDSASGGFSHTVDIVISDTLPAYEGVAVALAERLTRAPRLHRLNGRVDDLPELVAALKSVRGPIIAIGPEAVQVAARAPARPMVYCQVYQSDVPAVGAHRGVKAVPPVAKQFRAWKLVDPRLRRVALLTGPGFKALAVEAKTAARDWQLELEHVEVRSDKELLYAVKRLDASIQGVWFAPDRRVLSTEVLREALSYSMRNGKSVLAFSPQLLPYGALLSAEGEYDDVAERVIAQLRQLEDGHRPDSTLALTRARVEINPLVARHLGLTVPPALQGGTHVF